MKDVTFEQQLDHTQSELTEVRMSENESDRKDEICDLISCALHLAIKAGMEEREIKARILDKYTRRFDLDDEQKEMVERMRWRLGGCRVCFKPKDTVDGECVDCRH